MANNYYAIGTTFVPGAKVRSDEVNAEFTALVGAFDNLPGSTEAIIRGTSYKGTESGTGNSYILTMDDTRSSYVAGDRVFFRATHTNTGATNINVDSLGLKSLVKADGDPCTAGDIISGLYYDAVYDATGNRFQLLSVNANVIVDSATQAGYSQEWATNPEDTLISTAAGGNGTTDYSSLHWAAKAAADVVLTNADVVLTNADVVSTNADVVLTNADVVLTNADVVSTGNNVTYSSEWAIKAEDVLVSVAAGGNGTTDYSSLHWAAKASASADAASISETNAAAASASAASDATDTAADLVQTNLDQISCDADATAAAASAAAALVSENNAAASYDAFDDRYLGSKAADPTLDNDGNALLEGALYWNSVNKTVRIYTGTVWQDVGASTANVTTYTATAGQTTFSGADDNALVLSYTVGFLQVYLNGVLLENTTDYTATNGTSIVLNTGASLGDVLQAFGFGTFDIANHYTKTEIDAAFAPITRPRKNMVINGGMQISQRGTSFTNPQNADYTLDRWQFGAALSVGAITISQETSYVVGAPVRYYLKQATTTANTSLAAGDHASIQYKIEGYDAAYLKWGLSDAKTVTLSFWTGHSPAGTYCVSFKNNAADRHYVAEYTHDVAGVWQKQEIVIPGDVAGTWLQEAGLGLAIRFVQACGTTYQTTADTWGTGNKFATSNQVNGLATIGNALRIGDVQLEVGDKATDFDVRDFGEELALCQRYFEKSCAQGLYFGDGTANGSAYGRAPVAGSFWPAMSVYFRVSKAGQPDISVWAPGSGTTNKIRNITLSTDLTPSILYQNENSFSARSSDSVSASNECAFNWYAEAEL